MNDHRKRVLLEDLEFIAKELEHPSNDLEGCAATVRRAAGLIRSFNAAASEKLAPEAEVLDIVYVPGESLKPVHKCERIAKAPFLHDGREYWLGKLTEKVPQWPLETHCLHMRTPLKDVCFLLNRGDFEALAVFCRVFFGHVVNESWMESMVKAYAANR